MASEKELFVTKQYVPMGEPIVKNENTIIYKVKCFAEPGSPEGILKMYRRKNIVNLYTRLYQLDYSEWPHIFNVKFFDGNTLVVEEFLNGHTLQELLDNNRNNGIVFSEEEAYRIMERICDCIQQLIKPQPPIIHHNLKPSNIFVTSSGAIKLLDFVPGVSKRRSPFHQILNTLGSIFHQMLTGNAPKRGKSIYKGRYEAVIRKCMEKTPEKQYQNMSELKEELADAQKNGSATHPGITGIPYSLTFPFQGFILAVEWLLVSFFWYHKNSTTMFLFLIIFIIHSLAFIIRRHLYMKEHQINVSLARKTLPILAVIAVLACLSWIISFIK